MPFAFAGSMPGIAAVLKAADRKDVRCVDCHKDLRQFLADLFSYMPAWLRWLYRARNVFAACLGQKPTPVETAPRLKPEQVSFAAGHPAAFFTVIAGQEGRYLVAEAKDGMIAGYLAVAVQPLPGGLNRFHVLTMAKYLHWTGRLYYNVIDVFHHLVVHRMVRHAAA